MKLLEEQLQRLRDGVLDSLIAPCALSPRKALHDPLAHCDLLPRISWIRLLHLLHPIGNVTSERSLVSKAVTHQLCDHCLVVLLKYSVHHGDRVPRKSHFGTLQRLPELGILVVCFLKGLLPCPRLNADGTQLLGCDWIPTLHTMRDAFCLSFGKSKAQGRDRELIATRDTSRSGLALVGMWVHAGGAEDESPVEGNRSPQHCKTDLLLYCLSFLPGIHLRVKGGSTHANILVDAAVTDLPLGSVALRPRARYQVE